MTNLTYNKPQDVSRNHDYNNNNIKNIYNCKNEESLSKLEFDIMITYIRAHIACSKS